MQITDSKEQILLGVQRLRTIASSCRSSPPPPLGLDMDLSSVATTSSTPLHLQRDAGSSPRPVQLELLPLRPTSHRALQLSSSLFADSRWGAGGGGGCSSSSLLPQLQAPFRGGIDVNQIPSSPESEDEELEDSHEPQHQPSPVLHLTSVAIEGSLKRARPADAAADLERLCEVSSRASDEEDGSGTRKKLRLSKDQSALLEESFKEQSTLNPKQKNALAKQLSLRPRQVEVWFQNRRARTKLKQTEVDCELLKRCCETLTEENRRLQKELQELRAIKVAAPCVFTHDFYMPLPAATLTMCPSCERLATTAAPAPDGSRASSLLSSLNKPHHLHHHHLHHHQFQQQQQQQQPSAAC